VLLTVLLKKLLRPVAFCLLCEVELVEDLELTKVWLVYLDLELTKE
jgi:hypothetical protein